MEWVYNEFKRNKVSVPYNQLEVRERKDNVNAPVIGKKLPERVEKVREAKKDKDVFNLLKKGLTKHEKKAKKKKKDKKQEIVTDKNILALSNLENATKSETQEENIVKVASVQEATNEKVEDKQEEKVEEKKSKRKKK